MTTDEARAALLVSFVGNATDSPIARALEPRIDALIAAVRAEYDHLPRCEHGAYREPYEPCRADAEATLRALREAVIAEGHRPVCAFCGGAYGDAHVEAWPDANCACSIGRGRDACKIGRALAATPAEDGAEHRRTDPAALTRREPLDVERLNAACLVVFPWWADDVTPYRWADRIAAEYSRLEAADKT